MCVFLMVCVFLMCRWRRRCFSRLWPHERRWRWARGWLCRTNWPRWDSYYITDLKHSFRASARSFMKLMCEILTFVWSHGSFCKVCGLKCQVFKVFSCELFILESSFICIFISHHPTAQSHFPLSRPGWGLLQTFTCTCTHTLVCKSLKCIWSVRVLRIEAWPWCC